MSFDVRVRALMESRKWTQIEAAQQLGVTQSWVSRVLSGRSRQLELAARVVSRLDELEREQPAAVAS